MILNVKDETAQLEAVIIGIGKDRGCPRPINPMIRMHLEKGTFPKTDDVCREIGQLESILTNNNVKVFKPVNIPGLEQIFVRDIGFVIEDYFFISNMKHQVRMQEIRGIEILINQIEKGKVVKIPKEITIEGGDIIPWKDIIFVGLGDRTTMDGALFLQKIFPNKQVLTFELVVDQDNFNKNTLHLDCTFQPIGRNHAIIYLDGFQNLPKELFEFFPKNNLIEISLDQKNRMFPNILSLSPSKIIIEKGFIELKQELINRKFEVVEVGYKETSKLNGLLRCSTLPLRRSKI